MQRRELMNTLVAAGAISAISTPSTASPSPSRTAASSSRRTLAGPYIEAHDGTQLYWTQWGAGRPILFLNSAGMTTQMWDYQMVAFADHGYRCISFDRRGHGQSDRPVGGYDFDTFADDVAAVVTALDLKELTIVGHSMAGGEMVRYLTRHGSGRVARTVMLAPTTPYLLKTADNPNGLPQPAFEALRDSWRKDYQSWVADNSLPFFVPGTSPSMIHWVAGILTQCPVQIAIACNIATTTTDFRRDLAGISVPTMIIHGDRDVSAPLALTGKPTAALIAGSRLKVYEGAPHGLMYTHMQMLTDDILQFIRES